MHVSKVKFVLFFALFHFIDLTAQELTRSPDPYIQHYNVDGTLNTLTTFNVSNYISISEDQIDVDKSSLQYCECNSSVFEVLEDNSIIKQYFQVTKTSPTSYKLEPGNELFLREIGKFCFKIRGEFFVKGGGRRATPQTFERKHMIIVRKPRKLVMLLDKSMSMECDLLSFPSADLGQLPDDVDVSIVPSCDLSAETSRWEGLKEGVVNFINNLIGPSLTLDEDEIHLIFFSGDVSNNSHELFNDFHVIQHFATPVNDDLCVEEEVIDGTRIACELHKLTIDDVLGRDGTSIGKGLEKAIEKLEPEPNPQNNKAQLSLILFSDGTSTRPPNVRKIADTERAFALIYENELENKTIDLSGIDVYVVAAGVPQDTEYQRLMQDLSSNSGPNQGFYVASYEESNGDLIQKLDNQIFVKFQEEFSPKNLLVEESPLYRLNWNKVDCARGVSKLDFCFYFSSPIAELFDYSLRLSKILFQSP